MTEIKNNHKPLRPFYYRLGAKNRLLQYILPLIPYHKIYVECFLGGGSVLFAKNPSNIEIVNDIDTQLINDYKLILDIKTKNFKKDLTTLEKQRNFFSKIPKTKADKITHTLLRHNNTFCGKEYNNGTKLYKCKNPIHRLVKLDKYQNRLKNVKFLNKNYIDVINEYDSPETFFYLDPPYENTNKSFYKNSKFNFNELRDILGNVKGYWMLSINASDYIKDLFDGYNILPINQKGLQNSKIGGKDRTEYIIMNYVFD
jgi:DNA adenine methylase